MVESKKVLKLSPNQLLDILLVAGILALALLYFSPTSRIVLWTFLPIGALICVILHKSLFFNIYLKFLFALFVWSSFTHLFSEDPTNSIVSVTRMWSVYLMAIIFSHLALRFKSFNLVNIVYIVFFITLLNYAYHHILIYGVELDSKKRLGDETLNANLFAYIFFFVSISVFYFGVISKNRIIKIFWQVLFVLLIPVCFYLAILTASRQVLIVQVPIFIALLWQRYLYNNGIASRILLVFIVILIGSFFYQDVAKIYDSSNLKSRSENIEDDDRIELLSDAVNLGLEHPVMGVGPDNFKFHTRTRAFSHNSFAELFANSGIIGLAIFVIMLFYFIRRQYRFWLTSKSSLAFLNLIFGISFIVANLFYVYYLNIWLMGYFILIGARGLIEENEFKSHLLQENKQSELKYTI